MVGGDGSGGRLFVAVVLHARTSVSITFRASASVRSKPAEIVAAEHHAPRLTLLCPKMIIRVRVENACDGFLLQRHGMAFLWRAKMRFSVSSHRSHSAPARCKSPEKISLKSGSEKSMPDSDNG